MSLGQTQPGNGAAIVGIAILVTLFLLARWVYRDALEQGLPRTRAAIWAVLSFLSLLFFAGYMIVRAGRRRTRA